MKKIAIITTHPIQYYAPVFQLLAKRVEVKVFYTWDNRKDTYDLGFRKDVSWDIPLLEGYEYEFVNNTAKNAGSHHRNGVINPDLNERITDFSPNAILIYGWNYDSHWRAMRFFKGKIPVWFRGDSTLLDRKPGLKSILKSLYLRWVYQHVDKAFYVGTNNKAYFKHHGLKEEQLVFAPHAIDNDRFAEDRKIEAQALRTQLGINEDDRLILFAGKLEPKKDPEILLEAFLNLNLKSQPQFHLLFVGNGVLEESLKLKVESLKEQGARNKEEMGNGKWEMETSQPQPQPQSQPQPQPQSQSQNIHCLAFQNQRQMPVVYQACDLFCLPSKGPGETWGLAVNEAMATGKAILVSDQVGCAIDLVSDKNGAIFKAGDLNDLQLKLASLLQEKIAEKATDLLSDTPHAKMAQGRHEDGTRLAQKKNLNLNLNLNLNQLGKNSKEIINNWSFEQQVATFVKELETL